MSRSAVLPEQVCLQQLFEFSETITMSCLSSTGVEHSSAGGEHSSAAVEHSYTSIKHNKAQNSCVLSFVNCVLFSKTINTTQTLSIGWDGD